MNAIAVSLYDKFDDLAVLVDIIRHNWEEDYYILVCSNHPDAHKKISAIEGEIDFFEQGAQIRYDDLSAVSRSRNNLSFRIYDSIRTSCRAAFAKDDVDYVMHLHADAWPLSEEEFKSLIQDMEQNNYSVAFPSNTRAFMDKYSPGSFEDNFLVFDAADAAAVNLFEHSPLELPPTWIHQILPFLCIPKFGWGKIYQYTNGAEREHWDGKPSAEISNDARPMFHNPTFGQVHIAKEDFASELGKALQSYYLRDYGITDGEYVQQLLDDYELPDDELFRRLDAYLERFNDELKWYLLSDDSFGRDIRKIKEFLEEKSLPEKAIISVERNSENLFIQPLLKGAFKSIKQLITDSPPESYNKYPNQSINDRFKRDLKESDFPKELREDYRDTFEKGDQ
ncbi:hypothetical protein [Natrinema marinum]|uniref:hypothetical protein n=1 Tax=Natrinema marinum TaxID=2961598 RepID=UPI0020C8E7B6|nr:hypothetical protein [Natrinema marinum]